MDLTAFGPYALNLRTNISSYGPRPRLIRAYYSSFYQPVKVLSQPGRLPATPLLSTSLIEVEIHRQSKMIYCSYYRYSHLAHLECLFRSSWIILEVTDNEPLGVPSLGTNNSSESLYNSLTDQPPCVFFCPKCGLGNMMRSDRWLAGPISHTSTQYIDFVDFLHFNGSVYQLFCSF